MINVPIKIETEDDNNLESSTSISAKTDISHQNHLSNGKVQYQIYGSHLNLRSTILSFDHMSCQSH